MPPSRRSLLLAAGLLALGPAAARAHSYRAGGIMIGHPWALPSEGPDGEAFAALMNAGPREDRLTGARTPAARAVELAGGAGFPLVLPPNRPIPMRPGALRFRLVGLAAPLRAGGRAPLVLAFAGAGEVETELHVEASPAH